MIRSQRGFTLLELIVSIGMISIIVLILAGALRLAYQSFNSGESRIIELEKHRSSLRIIDSQIQSHVPLSYEDAQEGGKKFYFRGGRDSMQFTTNYSIWGGEKGFVLASYTVRSDEDGTQSLSVSENIIGMEQQRETTLFDDYNQIYFEYFYKDPFEEEGRWVEQWEDELNLPTKVRVHLIRGAHDLNFLIPVRVTGEASDLT